MAGAAAAAAAAVVAAGAAVTVRAVPADAGRGGMRCTVSSRAAKCTRSGARVCSGRRQALRWRAVRGAAACPAGGLFSSEAGMARYIGARFGDAMLINAVRAASNKGK